MAVAFETRKTWTNVAGTRRAEPLRIYEPTSTSDVVAIVQEAQQKGVQVRAVGSGHSWSDVALTSGFLLKPDKLDEVLPLPIDELRAGVDTSTLFRIESGTTIADLNDALDQAGLALPNMGGYDGQTFVGATSTSTHGSGLAFGPLSDLIQSVDLVADGGVLWRVEPQAGPTDPQKFASGAARRLWQDDTAFDAVRVGLGCMGVIVSVMLRVRESFHLNEVRQLSTWAQVEQDLAAGQVLQQEHYEVLVNPYAVGGQHRCLTTTRTEVPKPGHLPPDKTRRNFFTELLASLPLFDKLAMAFFDLDPQATPELIDRTLEGLVDRQYTHKSYKVFNIGVANRIPAVSAEIALPMKDKRYLAAVNAFLGLCRGLQELGRLYLTAPASLRFVKGTSALLSPQHGGDTCMLEIIVGKGTQGASEMYEHFEDALYAFGGRPHWGQVNSLTGSHDLLKKMYPRLDDWLQVCRKLNAKGTFDGPFSKRVGFAEPAFPP